MREMSIYPGAIAANADIALPFPLEVLLRVIVKERSRIVWSGLGAAGATIATDDVAAAGSGSDTLSDVAVKTIVTTAPAAGQVQLVDKNTIRIGDALLDCDLVIVQGHEEGIKAHTELV